MTAAVQVSLFTTASSLGKEIKRDPAGAVAIRALGEMVRGSVAVRALQGPAELVDLLTSATTKNALCASIPRGGLQSADIVTKDARPEHPGAISRSKDCFEYPAGPGLLILDYDPRKDEQPLTRLNLWAELQALCPAVNHAPVVWAASASSCVYADDGTEVRGLSGQRLYLFIENARDTPRAMQVLSARAWLRGLGWMKITASGAMRAHDLFDMAMANVGRLDFVGGAAVGEGLRQDRPRPVVMSDGAPLDTLKELPDLSAQEAGQHAALVAAAKAQAEPLAAAAKADWLETRQREGARKAIDAGEDPTRAREDASRTWNAALAGTLLGTFEVTLVIEGKERPITVQELLADPQRWHGATCLDPVHPEHRNRAADAVCYLLQASPCIWSLDDHGKVYKLTRAAVRLPIINGERANLAQQITAELSQHTDLFLLAGAPCLLTAGHTMHLSRAALAWVVGSRFALYRRGKDKDSACEADNALLDMIQALLPQHLRHIVARSTIPLVTAEGRVLDRSGFDIETGVYLDIEPGGADIPQAPSRTQAVEALRRLWKPWSQYRWADGHSAAAMLSTVLSVPIRPCIDIAPGTFTDSPRQGSGKSRAVGAIAALCSGEISGARTWTPDEIEASK